MVWRHRKMLKLLKQMSSCSCNKKLFDSISEGAWKLPSFLFLIFCRFPVKTAISQSSCGTRANMRDLVIATSAKQVPRRDWYASAISKLRFSNTNLKIVLLWHMTHQPGTYQISRGDCSALRSTDMTVGDSKAGYPVDEFCTLVRLMDTGRSQNLLCVPESESCPRKIRAYFDTIR